MLSRSPDTIYCQTCANGWPLTDSGTQFYFRGALAGSVVEGHDIGDYTSPAAIAAIDPAATITFCPRCDVEQLEPSPIPGAPAGVKGRDPFYERDDPMTQANVDAGQQDDPGDATVVHKPDVTP